MTDCASFNALLITGSSASPGGTIPAACSHTIAGSGFEAFANPPGSNGYVPSFEPGSLTWEFQAAPASNVNYDCTSVSNFDQRVCYCS